MKLVKNALAAQKPAFGARERAILSTESSREPLELLKHCPHYRPTPMHALPALAALLGLHSIHVKDESRRFSLLSFKALGGVYAVATLVRDAASRETGKPVSPGDLVSDEVRRVASRMTFTCATDGNHGRAVACGARLFGARSVVFLPAGVTALRADAIAGFGAEIVRTDLDYDGAVAAAARAAVANGWTLVSDTAQSADERVPRLVMEGYTVMACELVSEFGATIPTHVFIQGGVGGLAASICGYFSDYFGKRRPCAVIVEPEGANCLQLSAVKGKPVKLESTRPTLMSMLECGEPSTAAWVILERHADYFLDVPDDLAVEAMRAFANPEPGDPELVLGESGAAGLAGLLGAARDGAMRSEIGLDTNSRVLLIGTEGATDPERYRELVERDPYAAQGSPIRLNPIKG